jgi:isobutyryl-CoA mutase
VLKYLTKPAGRPSVGFNTDPAPSPALEDHNGAQRIRPRLVDTQHRGAGGRPSRPPTAQRAPAALARLQQAAAAGGNVFAELMECVKVCSLGQISRALYQVGGQYRRNM